MHKGVCTYAEFSSHLSAIVGRHPHVTDLRLQLLPPARGPRPPRERRDVQSSGTAVESRPSVEDSGLDFTTLYAVLLSRRGDDGGNSETVAVYTVVGHVSHISLNWCAQLQRSLSVTALLAAPTRSLVWHADGFHESEVGTILGRECMTGVSSFEVRLSPYVPPLQWCRAVDGVFGSHHFVCGSYTCGIDEPRDDNDDSAGAAHTREAWKERDTLRTPPKAVVDAAATDVAPHTPSAGPPVRMPRREGALAAVWAGTPAAEETPCCSFALSSGHLPLRVAGVLNGNMPLDNATSSIPGTRVLCLVALDGSLLTGRTCPDSPSPSWSRDLFDTLCDFISRDVMPRVSLRLIDGTWARAEASEHLLDDVCQVRQMLGTSYVVQYPSDAAAAAATRARSIVMVLDLSVPLQKLLSTLPSMRTSSPSPATDAKSERRRRCLATQFAEAVQDTIGQLVSQHPDVFAFTREAARATESALVAQLSRGPTHFTREMLCRSIAASVSQILSLSSNAAFVEEVVRLLWGCETHVEATDVATATERSRESLRISQRQPVQIQRRIEERLMSAIPP
ncbi:hypothetical protein CGC20_2345 [Leishmania donovani]|uniref:Uncharacterized protein n=2 Tax=Leishmania donovani TaxID=5661 RepID=A0A504XRS3_LEIDO|nr:hypothetical protein CGC20_2345 [Leishmania donovani]